MKRVWLRCHLKSPGLGWCGFLQVENSRGLGSSGSSVTDTSDSNLRFSKMFKILQAESSHSSDGPIVTACIINEHVLLVTAHEHRLCLEYSLSLD